LNGKRDEHLKKTEIVIQGSALVFLFDVRRSSFNMFDIHFFSVPPGQKQLGAYGVWV
jgi:hypothetical protein